MLHQSPAGTEWSTLLPFLPSILPSFFPSFLPSFHPSFLPSFYPSFLPSFLPFFLPSFLPSIIHSLSPSLSLSLPHSLLQNCVVSRKEPSFFRCHAGHPLLVTVSYPGRVLSANESRTMPGDNTLPRTSYTEPFLCRENCEPCLCFCCGDISVQNG